MDTLYFQSVGIIHETTAPYTPQQNDISERKNIVLKEMVNSMLSYSSLSQGFWGEAMLTACYLLNRVPNKRNRITPYELWTKKKPNLNYLRVWGYRAIVRLPDLKMKTLGERGIECIFVGYDEHSKGFRFYVIKPNDSVAINSIIESRDVIFDEHRFSSVPRPSQRSLVKGTIDSGGSVVSERVTNEIVQQFEPRKSKRHRNPKDFGQKFKYILTMKSQDVAFWKEAINDEMDSIMGNNTWVLTDLPPGCRPQVMQMEISKKKAKGRWNCLKSFRARLLWHNIISEYSNQMDVKIAFLNRELEEGVYMNQPLGFILPGNENKVDLTKEFLSSRFSMKDMGEADVILASGYIPDIAFAVGKLSRYTSNPGTQHWQAIQRVLKYLKKTMDYRLTNSGYPSVLEGYTDAS
ncbi:zinc finger, CCHC-type containing protein [Tanacetum coccineum]